MGGEVTPPYPGSPSLGPADDTKERGGAGGGGGPPGGGGGDGIVVKEQSGGQAVEDIPTTSTRRWWLRIVWLCTWLIPSFLLRIIGRMKRPDVRLAWREKVTIFWLIFLFNGIIIFYIVEFGRLLCPNYDKAWKFDEVSQHQGDDDWWVSVAGVVYDLSNFIGADHSRIVGNPSNSPENREQLAGSDMTYYFSPPLSLACPGLVDDTTLALTRKNFTPFVPLAIHTSGTNYGEGPSENLRRQDWYSSVFLKKMDEYKKGPLVWEKKEVLAQAKDENIQRCVVFQSASF
jgi:chitin synthase